MLTFGQPMIPTYKSPVFSIIRLYFLYILIFFVLFFPSCTHVDTTGIKVVWIDKKATTISIPAHLAKASGADSLFPLKVRIANNKRFMVGDIRLENKHILFTPLIALTRGLTYEVLAGDKVIGSVEVPLADAANAPEVLHVYPSADTLPENLLKLYLQFSKPMREGEILHYVFLLDKNNDTLSNVFLDLNPALWNEDRTVLTLWLDPGRIKRDLIPNRQMGNPLSMGKRYTLIIANAWKDGEGLNLRTSFTKQFYVEQRDSISPNALLWPLKLPASQTKQPMGISLNEPLDYFLLQETVHFTDDEGKKVAGKIEVKNQERNIEFIPHQSWQKGWYKISVEHILEDLAGNNLNRPFDRDTKVRNPNLERKVVERSFEIR